MVLKEIKNIFHKELDGLYVKEEVDSFFYILIEHYLNLQRFVLALQPNLTLTKEEEQPLFEALSGLKLQRPVQYIIGSTSFMDLDFQVNENVLIPRPETEDLIRWIVDEVKTSGPDKKSGLRILDIGTGSGCIAISLAKLLPDAKVFALDVSEKALETAKRNAERNAVKVEFIHADILNFDGFASNFDVIVSNPPYVRELEKKEMHKNVLEHEPDLALFVSDENPLVFYKAITQLAKQNLSGKGMLFFEINQYLAKETEALLHQHNFIEIEVRKDIFGNDRMTKSILG
ncbi:peptide chain release factor N(5)-glutamine methyltransferase [Zobellia laminariae]|uniref:peptide chain release factor N(5)-glutamine methyltransferase n=1 Tax=Zobellia laminariae TaxID=248906 RepID=UPI0026F471C1|nr:peptide chain release factor N(5)-glutamine methyltransferase [Zobellia laminariae]WKX75405.1 peptide chain release factor N(5)-glutamine methyltransferase [Zobellia laminariae]